MPALGVPRRPMKSAIRFPVPAFLFLVAAGMTGAALFTGCGGDSAPAAAPDTGTVVTDTGTTPVDTGTPKDTGTKPDVTVLGCMQPLPTDFVCKAPGAKAGKTVCTDAMIEEFTNCFGSAGSTTKCSAATKAYPECNTCILKDWLYNNSVDVASCIAKVLPTDKCATTVRCNVDCLGLVCPKDDCDTTPGSGSSATRSQADDCFRDAQFRGSTLKPKGACYDVATKDYADCAAKPELAYCFVTSITDLTYFFRGACRDGGDWSKADVTKPTDAGVDSAAADTTAADTAAADTAATDGASGG